MWQTNLDDDIERSREDGNILTTLRYHLQKSTVSVELLAKDMETLCDLAGDSGFALGLDGGAEISNQVNDTLDGWLELVQVQLVLFRATFLKYKPFLSKFVGLESDDFGELVSGKRFQSS